MFFVVGIVIGSAIAMYALSDAPFPLLPEYYQGFRGAAALFVGGVLVGFGTRYADGCTSGHSIMGMSNLKWPSLVATIGFFIGGLIITFGVHSTLWGEAAK